MLSKHSAASDQESTNLNSARLTPITSRCQERSILSQSSSARVPYNIKPIFSRTINLQMIHNLVELAFQLVKTFKSLFSALDLASIAAS
jgi:hypothetical protein